MNSNYILPVSVAAAIHGALLFGFTKSPRPLIAMTDPRPLIRVAEAPKEIEIPEQSDPVEPNSSTKEAIVAPQPTSLEPLTPVVGDPITMRLPPIVPTIPGDSKTIIPQASGIGDGTDWRSKIASSLELDNSPRARFQAQPVYPFDAKRNGLSGDVWVEFIVDESGNVLEPRVVRSSDRVFEENTLRAVAKWKFEPGRSAGRIVRFRMAVPVVFNLNE